MSSGKNLILSAVNKESSTNSNNPTNLLYTTDELKQSLNGSKLIVATLNDFPLNYNSCENGNCTWKGVSFEILDFLAKKFNFSYEVVLPRKNIIGSTQDMDGSLLELMKNKTIDLTAAFIPLLADARDHIFYSTTSLDEGEWIMIMKRPLDSAGGSGLLAPFETNVWLLILVSLLAVGPIIYFLIIIRNKLTGDDTQKPYKLSHCVWFVYGGLMKQGSTLSPIADSTRLLFATWWIFITILTSFYTANLTAYLTLSTFTLPIKNADDILKKEQKFVAHRGCAVEYSIRNTDEALSMLVPMVQKNKTVFTENLNDTETLLNLVEKNNFVFVRDRPAINYLIYSDYKYRKTKSTTDERIHCPFAISASPFLKKRRTFAYPMYSKWRQLFDPELLNLVESGIVKYLLSENSPQAEICPNKIVTNERQLRNGDLLMTYYIMLAGFATSSVIFVTELIFRYINNRTWKSSARIDNFYNRKGGQNKMFTIKTVTPPPSYGTIFKRSKNAVMVVGEMKKNTDYSSNGVKKIINGRDYMVFRGLDGERTLVPVRSPSANLFQYAYTE